jgi:glycosyltransferase involved in cell wall biosynthesis
MSLWEKALTYHKMTANELDSFEITLCIPTYNVEKYLNCCLESLTLQTNKSFRIAFVDDASTDSTVEIIRSFMNETSIACSLYRHSKNSGGMGLAVQESMARCTTPFFMWMGADDELSPYYIDTLYTVLSNDKSIDYAYSNIELINEMSEIIGRWTYPNVTYRSLLMHILETQSGILPMIGILRMSFIRNQNLQFELFENENFSSDTLNSLHFMSKGMRIYKVKKDLFRYRKHSDQGSNKALSRCVSDLKVLTYIFARHTKELETMNRANFEYFARLVDKSILNNKARFSLTTEEYQKIFHSKIYKDVLNSVNAQLNKYLTERTRI